MGFWGWEVAIANSLLSTIWEATKVKSRRRKLDWKELEKDVKQNPESKLADRAKKFGVNTTAIFYALKRMKITRKKTTALWRKK